ncbi:MAG: beta-galactosidase [Acidimicrobiales bacterium]
MDDVARPRFRMSRRQLLGGAIGAGALAFTVGEPGRWGASFVDDIATAAASMPLGAASGAYPMALTSAVYGGELQYFRMTPSTIPSRLGMCRQAAYSVIQTYVPWNVHEYHPGRIDFTGQTHPVLLNDHHLDPTDLGDPVGGLESGRQGTLGIDCNTDLEGFLTMCKDAGFKVILRPGPFISDEWRNGGFPDWFLESASPEMFEYGPDGTPLTPGLPWSAPPETATGLGGMSFFYFPSPSYASPEYLAGVKRWLVAFADFVRPWLVTNGGPVVAVQVDDETCYYYHFGPFEVDYNPAVLARYRQETGEDPPRAWPLPVEGVESLRPAFTWQRFKGQQIATYFGALASYLSSGGVDVPITHEIELSLAPPADVAADAGAVLVNPELYPGANGPEVMPLVELTANSVRAAQRNRLNVWSAETQSGQVLLYTLLLGEGIIGSLQFTYATGVPDGAVTATGRLGRALRHAGALVTESTRRADVAIVWDNDLTRAPYESQRWGFTTDVRAVIERHVPALATLLVRSGFAFDLLDTTAAQAEDYLGYPTIFLAAADILARAAQDSLVAYVKAGGRLVCWAAPPHLDENLDPYTALADACFPERRATFYPADTQQIELLGQAVTTWLGVQTFELSSSASVVATRQGVACGYQRPLGRGQAVLLGTWLAADSVPGRAGAIIDEEPVPATAGLPAALAEAAVVAQARRLAASRLGPAAAAMVPAALPGGQAEQLLVYAYTNQRRGGEYISGGALAYWNGEHVVGLVEVNSALTATPVQLLPYRPPGPAHVAGAQALAGVTPQVVVSDLRVQARILDAPGAATATVVANNRWGSDVAVVLTTTVDGMEVRLPSTGHYTLPAETGVLLPIGYPVGSEVIVTQATVQLTGAAASGDSATVEVWAPSVGEVVVRLPSALTAATLDGEPVTATAAGRGTMRILVPAGDHTIALSWEAHGPRVR